MKPLYLEIEGVKSVSEKQTVNFERVAKSGIFGVFGKTGSGKTTILDSIVLALYGDVTNSVGNKDFVNTGCNRARVMLTFSVQENGERVIYKAERVYKFDKKRENLTSSAYLSKIVEGEEYPIAENTKQVNEKIENEIIGLDKKDFLKCIALPQGAFSDFIKQTRSLRLSFVGKLFGLEKYGKPLADKITLKDRILNKMGLLKSSKSGFSFFYRKENAPPVDEKWVLKKVDKKYDLVIVVFWQGLLSFSTIEKLYDKLKCQFHFRFVDYSPMSGGCHFTMDCDRYKIGCGMCPAFGSTNKFDFTAYNVKERMRIYDKVKPVIYGNSYMQSFYKDSFLLKNMQYESSYPIVNESEFSPLNRLEIRMELGISETKKFLILFGCQHLNDVRKGINYLF